MKKIVNFGVALLLVFFIFLTYDSSQEIKSLTNQLTSTTNELNTQEDKNDRLNRELENALEELERYNNSILLSECKSQYKIDKKIQS